MTTRRLSIAGVVCSAALMSALTPAGSVPTLRDTAWLTPHVAEQQQDGIAYVNAGAGKEEVALLKQMAGQYPLRVIISGKGGEYGVADSLRVSGAQGVQLDIPDAGPWVLLKLPPGSYMLEARFGSRTERRSANVGQGATVVHWSTPAASG